MIETKVQCVWSLWQFSFGFWTKWNSVWFKIKRKTIITIIFHLIWKEIETHFWECRDFMKRIITSSSWTSLVWIVFMFRISSSVDHPDINQIRIHKIENKKIRILKIENKRIRILEIPNKRIRIHKLVNKINLNANVCKKKIWKLNCKIS